jgi:hypothetical protein
MSTVYKTYVSDFKEAIGEARKKIQEAQVVDGGAFSSSLAFAAKSYFRSCGLTLTFLICRAKENSLI